MVGMVRDAYVWSSLKGGRLIRDSGRSSAYRLPLHCYDAEEKRARLRVASFLDPHTVRPPDCRSANSTSLRLCSAPSGSFGDAGQAGKVADRMSIRIHEQVSRLYYGNLYPPKSSNPDRTSLAEEDASGAQSVSAPQYKCRTARCHNDNSAEYLLRCCTTLHQQ